MSLIEKVASLRELKKKAAYDRVEYGEFFKCRMADAAPDLLEVLAGFQPGFSYKLGEMIESIDLSLHPELRDIRPGDPVLDWADSEDIDLVEWKAVLQQLQAMARLMEASQ